METRPKDSGSGGGKTREEVVLDKAKELLATLPEGYVDAEVKELVRRLHHKGLGVSGFSVPLNIFLYQEICRMDNIIGIVKKSLSDIGLAIEGTIIMTDDIFTAIDNVFDAKVP